LHYDFIGGPIESAVATFISRDFLPNAGAPAPEWQQTPAIRFSADWQGRDPDPELETEVRLLWSDKRLYLRFICRYRELFLFADSPANGRRAHLWDRDVAEAFLQPSPSPRRCYKEFEIAPNGMWIDLDIMPSGLADLRSGLTRSVHLDDDARVWSAEMSIPVKALSGSLCAGEIWHANFYRVEGKTEPRRYMAWRPTGTPQPDFHVPDKFGTLLFM
jgi:hypothetical protein